MNNLCILHAYLRTWIIFFVDESFLSHLNSIQFHFFEIRVKVLKNNLVAKKHLYFYIRYIYCVIITTFIQSYILLIEMKRKNLYFQKPVL